MELRMEKNTDLAHGSYIPVERFIGILIERYAGIFSIFENSQFQRLKF